MRIVVTGATGNVGASDRRRLRRELGVEVTGLARLLPVAAQPCDDVSWHAVDIMHAVDIAGNGSESPASPPLSPKGPM